MRDSSLRWSKGDRTGNGIAKWKEIISSASDQERGRGPHGRTARCVYREGSTGHRTVAVGCSPGGSYVRDRSPRERVARRALDRDELMRSARPGAVRDGPE